MNREPNESSVGCFMVLIVGILFASVMTYGALMLFL